jgi:hypothetical protein
LISESTILCVFDQGTRTFEASRSSVDVVCLGDSLTGWNNFGPAQTWPCPTYPQFLQEMCQPLGLHPHAEGAMIIAEEVFKVLQGSGLLARGANVLADDQVVVMPEETDEILANPGMG